MPLIIKEEINNRIELPTEDNHVAVCVGVWDVGKQRTEYNNEIKIKQKVMFRWEIDEEITQEGEYKGKKKCINKFYTYSFHQKSRLRQDIESWIGSLGETVKTGFDLEDLVGKACMLNIVHNNAPNNKTYANVKDIAKLPKGLKAFAPDNLYQDNEPEFVDKIRASNRETLEEPVVLKDPVVEMENKEVETEVPF